MARLPKLYSLPEFSAASGISEYKLRRALKAKRLIPMPQLVGGIVWVFSEDTKIMRSELDPDDPFVASLPVELIADELYIVPKPRKNARKPGPGMPKAKKVTLWGYNREVKGYTRDEIYHLTRVHYFTQAKLRENKEVKADVALRLSRGLRIPIQDLLRR